MESGFRRKLVSGLQTDVETTSDQRESEGAQRALPALAVADVRPLAVRARSPGRSSAGLLWPLRERSRRPEPARRTVPAPRRSAAIAVAAVLVGVLLLPGERLPADPSRPRGRPGSRSRPRSPQPGRGSRPARCCTARRPSFGAGERRRRPEARTATRSTTERRQPAAGEAADERPERRGRRRRRRRPRATKPVPAGPAAMKVARRFSEAFVFYEIGERPARAKTVFGETATPRAGQALGERPPRLPANARCRRPGCSTSSPAPAPARPTRSASRCCGSA